MYNFDLPVPRGQFIEGLYAKLNVAGEMFSEEQRAQVCEEALECFRLNAVLYAEDGLYGDAVRGTYNMVKGAVFSLKPEGLKHYGRRRMN